jgi:hypothetical protein
MAEVWKEGELVDAMTWLTPLEEARMRLQAQQKTGKKLRGKSK